MLYALTLLDSDQEPSANSADDDAHRQRQTSREETNESDSCHSVAISSTTATAKEGLAAMQMHVLSAAKFGPSASALLLPCYGSAELPQVTNKGASYSSAHVSAVCILATSLSLLPVKYCSA